MKHDNAFSFEELLMPEAIRQVALLRLHMEKRIFPEEEFLQILRVVGIKKDILRNDMCPFIEKRE